LKYYTATNFVPECEIGATAIRDLKSLTELGVFKISESKGSGTFY